MRNHDPFFIVGSERSGTTLLRLMMTSHPALAVPPEGDFLLRLRVHQPSAPAQQQAFFQAFLGIEKCAEWGLTLAELTEACGIFQPRSWPELAALPYWTWLAKSYPDASRWGDKNPCFVHRIPALVAMYPRARFVHIIRDGRDVAASWLKVHFGPADVTTAARTWRAAVAAGLQAARRFPSQVYTIRYEDLLRDPVGVLTGICRFLHEVFSPEMMGYSEENQRRGLVPSHRKGWHQLTFHPPDPSRIGAWRGALSAEQVRRFEAIAADALSICRYDLTGASPQRAGVV